MQGGRGAVPARAQLVVERKQKRLTTAAQEAEELERILVEVRHLTESLPARDRNTVRHVESIKTIAAFSGKEPTNRAVWARFIEEMVLQYGIPVVQEVEAAYFGGGLAKLKAGKTRLSDGSRGEFAARCVLLTAFNLLIEQLIRQFGPDLLGQALQAQGLDERRRARRLKSGSVILTQSQQAALIKICLQIQREGLL